MAKKMAAAKKDPAARMGPPTLSLGFKSKPEKKGANSNKKTYTLVFVVFFCDILSAYL